jgi:hypothetical protein
VYFLPTAKHSLLQALLSFVMASLQQYAGAHEYEPRKPTKSRIHLTAPRESRARTVLDPIAHSSTRILRDEPAGLLCNSTDLQPGGSARTAIIPVDNRIESVYRRRTKHEYAMSSPPLLPQTEKPRLIGIARCARGTMSSTSRCRPSRC